MEQYKTVLSAYLKAASSADRSVYAREEVCDILLDLWNALDADTLVSVSS